MIAGQRFLIPDEDPAAALGGAPASWSYFKVRST
jgi:hypothetical protein